MTIHEQMLWAASLVQGGSTKRVQGCAACTRCRCRQGRRLHSDLASVQLSYGEFHKIVGGHPSLGNWDVDAAPEMSWSDGDTWRMDVQLPANQQIEFKVRCMHRLVLSVRPRLEN